MTGLAPNLSIHRPTSGDKNPVVKPRVNEKLIWVRVHPNSCSSGSTNEPKAYCAIPMANPDDRNAIPAIGQPR